MGVVITDAFGVSVEVGDTIAYAVRHSSSMYLIKAQVLELPTEPGKKFKVKRLDSSSRWGNTLERRPIVVLHGPTFVRVGPSVSPAPSFPAPYSDMPAHAVDPNIRFTVGRHT